MTKYVKQKKQWYELLSYWIHYLIKCIVYYTDEQIISMCSFNAYRKVSIAGHLSIWILVTAGLIP